MKQNIFRLMLFTTGLAGCITGIKEDKPKPFPFIINDTGYDKLYFMEDGDSPTWLTTARYEIYFIGIPKDTIYINHINFEPPDEGDKETKQVTHREDYYIPWGENANYKSCYDSRIEIRTDVTKRINDYYPVLITNNENDTIVVATEHSLPIIMEAKDSSGTWRPIEKRLIFTCSVGIGSIILPPKESILTLAPIYKGNYKTELRLSIGDNHSVPFIGFINYRQFQSRYDESGNYNEVYKSEMENKDPK